MARAIMTPEASARLSRTGILSQDVSRLKYVSGTREEALLHIPRRYLDFTRGYSIETAPLDQVCTIIATVDRVLEKRPRPRLTVTEVMLVDDSGVLRVSFFKQPWIAKQLKPGDRLAVMGKVEFAFGFKQMTSPHYERLDSSSALGSIVPVHGACEGLSAAWMRRIVSVACETADVFCDPLPAKLRATRRLMSISRALRSIHFPSSLAEVPLARRRLAYDEVLYLQLALRLRNDANLLGIEPVAHVVGERVSAVMQSLPFELSDEQQAAVDEILCDMQSPDRIMNRLLLGDVGTGKTAVAMIAMGSCADTGTQACVMAPTSVLARQYASSCMPVLERAGIRCALLTGSTSAAERDRIVLALAAGELDVLFGTHAVLGDDVVFSRLSLVVIDEQHRFGVGQRNLLRAKGPGADLLVMTATPIPRTLALSVYGDLETSIIRHRPVRGAGVTTRVLAESSRDIAYGALRAALEERRQAYVICPLVSDKDDQDALDVQPGLELDEMGRPVSASRMHSVGGEVEHLSQLFPAARVAALHGRLSARDKDRVIDSFRAGEIDILVATTVVEVGVDVPRATVMIIENGERFGLVTLHQLRGRVGRGSLSGTCFVLSQLSGSRHTVASDRLESLEKSEDGFTLAEEDLRLRHEGEILGLRQHGGVTLRFVDLDADTDIIDAAHEDARELLRYAPTLSSQATLPLRLQVIERYGNIFKEVSGG